MLGFSICLYFEFVYAADAFDHHLELRESPQKYILHIITYNYYIYFILLFHFTVDVIKETRGAALLFL